MVRDIDEQLRALERQHDYNWEQQDNNWQRIIFKMRRHLEIWNHRYVRGAWGDLKQSYFPVIFNLSVDGITASEMVRRSMAVKQNMSRTIKELEEKGMITSHPLRTDKRSEWLTLTPEGKSIVLDAHQELDKLQETYRQLVGKEDWETTLKVLNKILIYHDNASPHRRS